MRSLISSARPTSTTRPIDRGSAAGAGKDGKVAGRPVEAVGAHHALHGDHDVAALAHAAELAFRAGDRGPTRPVCFSSRQPHPLERAQPAYAQGLTAALGQGRDHEHVLAGVLQDAAVERREALGARLVRQLDAALPFELLPQLAGDQLARTVADAVTDVVACHDEVLAAIVVAGDDDVAVRVAGVEVIDGNPVEFGPKSCSIPAIRSRTKGLRSRIRAASSGATISRN